MGDKVAAPQSDTSKSDDEQFEDAQSKEDFNERAVDEIIEKVTGLATRKPPDSDADVFVDCVTHTEADGTKPTKPTQHVHNDKSVQEQQECDSSMVEPSFEDDLVDEDSQRDYECGLSEVEKDANKTKADELKQQGNELFKQGEHLKSLELYTQALRLCPLDCKEARAILYANRAAAKTKLDRKRSALDDCTKALEYNPNYVKALLRRANLYEETDKLDESLEDYKKVLELEPANSEARSATVRLPPKIAERNERLKEEMMGKLKDLGNMILRPFGLSTQNFEMKQDPQTGSYSINFNQGAKQ
ncbi:tetratricopeptide repeat protein 1 [Anopheles maculipalpis]|uniref:tetratricopeptide repeat protein 1 n=1 Tax=Anopheles maculipalpis TaxID=1496333 RepID=UPI002158BC4E|nr:tetratricopeptide repeat protein 1 [Anopheles maculipalpis]